MPIVMNIILSCCFFPSQNWDGWSLTESYEHLLSVRQCTHKLSGFKETFKIIVTQLSLPLGSI